MKVLSLSLSLKEYFKSLQEFVPTFQIINFWFEFWISGQKKTFEILVNN